MRNPNPDLPVARVVAASSAFPPVLSTVQLKVNPKQWVKLDGADLFGQKAFIRKLIVTDGGVYDNMVGLEAIWDRCDVVLVSGVGAPLSAEADPPPIGPDRIPGAGYP